MISVTLQEQVDLQAFNTLGVSAVAEFYCQVNSAQGLAEASDWASDRNIPITLLGGGSNVVLQPTIAGLVILNQIMGLQCDPHDEHSTLVSVGAGESWHDTVRTTLERGLYGLENLSLIPGTVGAAPVQNIGAYGVEVKDHFWRLTAFDRFAREWVTCDSAFCQFAYRDSVFKRSPGRYLISEVSFLLSHRFEPVLSYGPLAALQPTAGNALTGIQVSDHICALRSQKLPNPAELPNAGSFFKNPVVDVAQFQRLKQTFPDLVAYEVPEGVKLAAGWLIDQAGFKGYRDPDTGVGMHSEQALVLVNPKHADATAIFKTVAMIQQAIQRRYGVALEVEPVLIG